MSSTALLSAAAALVSTSTAWTTHANARDASGVWCPYDSPAAKSWDIFGALKRAESNGSYTVLDYWGAYEALRKQIPAGFHHGNQDIELYNDSLIFAQVAGVFTAAQSAVPTEPHNTAVSY